MKLRGFLIVLLPLLLFGSVNPDPYPDTYFNSPLKIPLLLAGSFAEMRANHFHAGLDIKTQGRAGYRVYAAADGWVSRIVVSPGGYGNALYISHPNGYMTVYAHLDRFNNTLSEYIKTLQYSQESFAVQSFPDRGQFPVLQGEVIAMSGNSGSSAGPHLHFEIRDERTGWPVNPILWGLNIKDTIPPRIYRFKVYPIGDGSLVRLRDSRTGGWRVVSAGESAFIDLTRKDGRIVMSRVNRIEASGKIGFGIQTHDYHNGSNSRLGIYRINLKNGPYTLFQSVMDRFSFDQTRYINAHIDYNEHRTSGRWVQLSHLLPGNQLPLYETNGNGLLDLEIDKVYDLTYRVEDAARNLSQFDFSVYGVESGIVETPRTVPADLAFGPDRAFTFGREDVFLTAPTGAFYSAAEFSYMRLMNRPIGVYSDVHQLHETSVPVHKWMTLTLNASELPIELRSKALIVGVNSDGKLSSAGGEFKDGAVTTRIREFGNYAVAVDNEPPSIRGLNISQGKNMSASGEIRVRIRDDLSGIQSYRGLIDGKWVLFQYDAKYSLLRHKFDGRVSRGSHSLDIYVTDNKNNESHLSLSFRR